MKKIDVNNFKRSMAIFIICFFSALILLTTVKVFIYLLENHGFEHFGILYWIVLTYIAPLVFILLTCIFSMKLKEKRRIKLVILLGLLCFGFIALIFVPENRLEVLIEVLAMQFLFIMAEAYIMFLNKIIARFLLLIPFALLIFYYLWILGYAFNGYVIGYLTLLTGFIFETYNLFLLIIMVILIIVVPFKLMFFSTTNNLKKEIDSIV